MDNKNNINDRQQTPKVVDYVVYRDAVQDYRRQVWWLIIALVFTVILLFASNIVWIAYESQFDTAVTTTTVDSEGNGVANYTGGDGGIAYGEGYSPNVYEDETEQQRGSEDTDP